MNLIFLGSAKFAVPSLKSLLKSGYKISCVVTQPDRRKGRHLKIKETLVKLVAQEAGLKIYQPEDINTLEAIRFLRSQNPDLFVVVSYGQILSGEILSIPKIFAINAHASILPKYRGAAPINWVLINGETTTGISIIKMIKKVDAGPIIKQKIIKISETDTFISLEEKLAELAAELLVESIKCIENNNYELIPQDEARVSFAPKLKKEDGLIPWDKSAREISNLIRGVWGWPGAFTYWQGKLLKIYRARSISGSVVQRIRKPGEIIEVSREGITVATAEGCLIIEELQIEGKRRMTTEEFIAGHKINTAEIFGKK
ncbi:MAG: methionyl-tRNA formyltransferase [Candidatus Omnitrophica bacterium]|nr:methionyl-tRNA formyltransferase [Candidatus Omnitrophota bacterium]